MSLGSSGVSSKGQIPRFHTPRSMQGIEAELDEHKKIVSMFQQAIEYSVYMTNIFFRLFDLKIKSK
jgi:hypothetical protein